MALLSLSGIRKSYRSGGVETPVLRSIDLHVHAGEHVAIMGPSGSGKSTLMNVLGLLDSADSGHYEIDGREATGLGRADQARLRNRHIGFVFQSFHLLKSMNIEENVALPLLYAGERRATALARAREGLGRLGLGALGKRRPNQLSGGQQQRVAIARALINDPPLLLADEPTGNLDVRTTGDVLDLLDSLNRERGLSILLVTHEPEVAQRASRLVRLCDGEIVYNGSPCHEEARA